MTIDIRATATDEARRTTDTVSDALLFPRLTDEEWRTRIASWDDSDSFSAWDGERCVGHASAFRFDSTVPGGARLQTAGVTRVAVLPTHTRRGLLREMMRRLLTTTRSNGAILAGLRASEAVIYGRFGFGIAAESAAVKVTTRSAAPVRDPAAGSMRLLAASELLDVVPDVYDRCGRRRAGSISRPPFMWSRYLDDAIKAAKPSFVAVHVAPSGALDGYVHYDVKWRETDVDETGAGAIHDLFGADSAVERALWAYVLDIDLVEEWRAAARPIDDSIRFALRDSRAYHLESRWDEQWMRILDVDSALCKRTWGTSQRSVVVHVTDPLFPDNCGAWAIDSSGAARTDAAPDLSVPVAVLSAAYLGGTSWHELADAALVEVARADAVVDADLLFAERPAPFCGSYY